MDYKSYFDIPKDITYLNTPGNGLMPITHHIWRRGREKDFFDVRGDLRDQQPDFIHQVKQEFGSLFGVDALELYLVPNFSFGLQTLLNGMPKGLKYGLLEEDYPSLNYPVLSRGEEYLFVKVDADLEKNIEEAVVNHNVDVLLLSIVQYINGIKIDLSFIKQLKQKYPNLIIIADATQFLGTEPFNFKESGFDVVGGSGYKWMMGGFGNGYMMLSPRIQQMIYVDAQRRERPKEAMWANKSILETYFEPGHQDTLSYGTLAQSVHFLKRLGLEQIGDYLEKLKSYAYARLQERNLLLTVIEEREIKSSLINVQIDPKYYSELMREGIKCFPRGNGIRIGLHLYNDKSDVDRFIEIIDKIK